MLKSGSYKSEYARHCALDFLWQQCQSSCCSAEGEYKNQSLNVGEAIQLHAEFAGWWRVTH